MAFLIRELSLCVLLSCALTNRRFCTGQTANPIIRREMECIKTLVYKSKKTKTKTKKERKKDVRKKQSKFE